MNLDTVVAIVSFVVMVAGYVAYRYFSENVYLKYQK